MSEVATSLAGYELVIEKGLASFIEVGEALIAIREQRLYRETHGTFEDYCQERWGFSVAQGKRLIQAAEVAESVAPIGAVPKSESVARELAPLKDEPEKIQAAWQQVVDETNGNPTAREVREIVATHRQAEPKPEVKYTACPTCGQRIRADRPLKGTAT